MSAITRYFEMAPETPSEKPVTASELDKTVPIRYQVSKTGNLLFESSEKEAVHDDYLWALALEGKSIVSMIYPVPYGYEQNWRTEGGKRGSQYSNLKHEVTRQLIRTAEKTVPQLSNRIEVIEAATPITLERYTLNSRGAAYGWDPTPEQSGTNRLQPKTHFANLYLTGHWTTPGGGTVTVALSGKRTAQMILRSSRT